MPRPGPWPLRALWLVVPLTAGPAFAQALDPRADGFRTVISVALWVVWAAILGATLVPRDVTLTAVRVVVPASLAAAAWAAASGASTTAGLVAIVGTALAAAAALAPVTSDAFVDGSSYGPETRLALRTPGTLLAGPVELAWVAAVGGAAAGPLLLAAHVWVAGGLALVIGWPVSAAAVRALHGLSRRFVVLVPAGLVLHDPLTVDALLFPRNTIARLGPALAGADHDRRDGGPSGDEARTRDLTGGALGLVLQLDLVEPVPLGDAPPGGRSPTSTDTDEVPVDRLLFSVARPGALLEAAGGHRIPVGS